MENLSKKIAAAIGENQNLSQEQTSVVAYGLTAFIQMVSILVIAITISLFTKNTLEAIIIFFGVGLIRKSTGGAHSKSIYGCLIVSVFSITILSIISGYIFSSNLNLVANLLLTFVIVSICGYIFYKKVPVDSKNKPIKKVEKIKRLRKQSFLIIVFVTLFSIISAVLFNNTFINKISLSIQLSLVWQTFTLTKPCTKLISAIDTIFIPKDIVSN